MDEPNFKPLIEELGIDKLPRESQERILEIAFRTVFNRVILRMAQDLTDEQVTLFENAVKKGDKAAAKTLEEIYPNFHQVYQEEIDGLKRDILAVTPGKHSE